jgi:hypothetical protein
METACLKFRLNFREVRILQSFFYYNNNMAERATLFS